MKKTRKNARKIAELRLEMKNVLIAHDIAKFRDFIEKNKESAADLASGSSRQEIDRLLTFDDDKLSDFMHFKKSTEPYLKEHFQDSRNHFRIKNLKKELTFFGRVNAALEQHLTETHKYPQCHSCKWFRGVPPGETTACMHLLPTDERPHQRPALPFDVACIGWTPLDENDAPVAEVKESTNTV